MATLNNRINKLERQSASYACIEDVIAVLDAEANGIPCDKEWKRIKSTKWWKGFSDLMKSINTRALTSTIMPPEAQ